ncbi:allergin-1 isoform X1 [Enhydra lutris kenyoni]|nr:allergin-1 isoform X1 [Enhydra lutris kenyoni]XP_022375591.1 allergin-1 isoform X1 [Enhydra lutris kenyoni]XP_022375592.1 allergin-1 isoform X1 [Enhydra lutris kenyoni]
MWRHLNKLFFWGIFSSLTLQEASLDCDTRRTNKFHSPSLDSETKVVTRGQNVSLTCSNQNGSLQITYFLFRREKHLRTHAGKGEPMIFNLSISEAHELGPYKCKAQVSNCSMVKYSREFNFTFVDPVTTPVLNIHVINTETDQHLILRCISFNGSLPISYTFFEKDIAISPPISKHVREPAEFNITKNSAGEREEYRCKAKNELPNHERYSQPVSINPPPGGESCPFCLQLLLLGLLLVLIVIISILAFWILPKYKARKAMRDKTPGDYRCTATEVGIYANFCENQAGKESVPGLEPRQCVPTAQDGTQHSQEIQYATPVFQKRAPGDHEARNDCKTGCIYSELIF